ncbi:Gfo/Idh/MocA family protein [Gorillibacterium sp. sgz5001074]|uniref:Gfo/Idh/MocA family protein n=1 Tax=Gorillibacterium sp. sgz5001074 TaxID=3446695 RepID=UPI003F67518E
MSAATAFAIIGGGFRAEFFVRIAQAMPRRFHLCGVVLRDEEKGRAFEEKWGVPAYRTLAELLDRQRPAFVIVSVSRPASPGFLQELADRGIPALAETPPAPDLPGLLALHELTRAGARIQVAEQYQYQPQHAAQIALAHSGKLGRITQCCVSKSHGYHGISLMRKLLGAGFENARIRAARFHHPMVNGPGRSGPPAEDKLITVERDLAWLEFDGGQLGIFDFEKDQHRSWIRSNHVNVRGERGEIYDNRISWLEDHATPVHLELMRINKGEDGNMEGFHLQGILAGDKWVYRNPAVPARLSDDEIAVAVCMMKMADYAAGGPEFYGLPEASQDHYFYMLMEQAIQSGEAVQSVTQSWVPDLS